MTNPTIVIIPGLWHKPAHYAPLKDVLEAAGYKVTVVDLPCNSTSGFTSTNWDHDTSAIRKEIQTVLDREEDVILVMHSYGGYLGSEAAKGLNKREREAKGLKGGVIHLVYMCAFAKDPSIRHPGQLFDWVIMEDDHARVDLTRAQEVFYNDVDDAKAKELVSLLEPTATGLWTTDVTYAAFRDIPATYVLCERDNTLPPSVQEEIVKAAGFKDVVRCNAGHSPFASQPEFVAGVIGRVVKERV